MTSKPNKLLAVLALSILPALSSAAMIEFAPDELPAETVVPVLDSNMAVKSKLIPLNRRFELGFTYSSIIDEMFFNNSLMGIEGNFYITEATGIGLKYLTRGSGLSTYSDQFSQTSQQLDFTVAPAPTTIMAATYRWVFLYGKVSFSKDLVLPTSIHLDLDLGLNTYGDQNLPYSSIGVGQRLYWKKHWGVLLAYRFLIHQVVDPISTNIGNTAPTTPTESDFTKKIQFSQGIDLGLSYLF